MEKETGSPKIVHTLGWTAAAIAAVVFAASAGVFAYRAISQPISAAIVANPTTKSVTAGASQSPTSKCAAENTFAINNYAPELQTIAGGHAKVEGLLGGNYRCSSICIPDKNGKKPEQADVGEYVKNNVKVNGQSVNIVDTGSAFIDLANTANSTNEAQVKTQLQNTVIISSTKRTCVGGTPGATTGNSVDYTSLQSNGKDIVLTQNETAKQIVAQKNEEFKIGTTGGSANPQTGAPSVSGLPSTPAGAVNGPGPVKSDAPVAANSTDFNATKANLLICQTNLKNNIDSIQSYTYPNGDTSKTAIQPRYSSFYNDYLQSYTAMNSKYAQTAVTDLKSAQTGLNWCSAIKGWAQVSIDALNSGVNSHFAAPTESQSTDFNSAKANFTVCETRLYDSLGLWRQWVYPGGDVTKTPTRPKYVDFYNTWYKSYGQLNSSYDQATTLDKAQEGLSYCNSISAWAKTTIDSDNGSGGAGAPTAQTTVVAGQTVAVEATPVPVPDSNPRSWARTGIDVGAYAAGGAGIGASLGLLGSAGVLSAPLAAAGGILGAIVGGVVSLF